MDCTKTLRLRIKDKHYKVLSAMAREVNLVWNFCNETSHRAIQQRHQWLSGYDLQKLTNGFSKCDGVQIGSPTVQQVCEDYDRTGHHCGGAVGGHCTPGAGACHRRRSLLRGASLHVHGRHAGKTP